MPLRTLHSLETHCTLRTCDSVSGYSVVLRAGFRLHDKEAYDTGYRWDSFGDRLLLFPERPSI